MAKSPRNAHTIQLTDLIVADTGPLIALAKLDLLELLPLLVAHLHMPQTVCDEATRSGYAAANQILQFIATHSNFVKIESDDAHSANFHAVLDAGEALAISLALKLKCPVLMDERLGRKVATDQGLGIIGVGGLLLYAKRRGLIAELEPLLQSLQHVGYHLSRRLVAQLLASAQE